MHIKELQARVDELKSKVDAKLAEIKDGMPDADVKRIESEHDALAAEYNAAKKRLEDAEVEAAKAEAAAEAEKRSEPTISPEEKSRIEAEARKVAVDAERKRANEIREMTDRVGMRELGDKLIKDNSSVEAAQRAIVDAVADKYSKGKETVNSRVEMGSENAAQRGLAMQLSVLHRFDPATYRAEFEANPKAREYVGFSLLEMAREDLEQKGMNTRGMSKMDIASTALAQRAYGQEMTFRSGGLMSTSDFPNVLANVLNKTLRAAYEAAGQTFRPLVREVTVPDFKQVQRTQLGAAPQLALVNEHGEFTRGSMAEAAEKYSIATYGKVIGITRQVLINDDLAAFTRIPRAFGVQAANLESDLVWAQILGNPTLNSDNTALFHANHKNLTASGDHQITVGEISTARTSMAKQTDLDGVTVLTIQPVMLIVPVAKQATAEQFRGVLYPSQNTNVVPDSMRQLAVISDPRLDIGIASQGVSGSATNWYMAASINQIDIVELAYLEGNRGVYTETRMGFDVDGIETKVRLDVGAKVIEYRGLYKVISTA